MIVDQLKRTAVEVRAGVSRDELALVVAETASLVEVVPTVRSRALSRRRHAKQ
jgi:hypothetical protein